MLVRLYIVRTTALSLCFSAGEYASAVWCHSVQAKKLDIALNETCRIITGCLKNTAIEKWYIFSGILSHIRRLVQADWEKTKIETDIRHIMHELQIPKQRLKSRTSFLKGTNITPSESRLEKWEPEINYNNQWLQPSETLLPGHKNKWQIWKSLNTQN